MSTRLQRIEENTQDARERLVRVETKLDDHLQLHSNQKANRRWLLGTLVTMGSAIIALATLVVNNYRTLHP